MTTVADVIAFMEHFAPLHLAESWDNVGLLLGDSQGMVERVMTCLTVTPETAHEAAEERAALVVSHHPILFKPTKTVRADRRESAEIWTLARAGVSLYSPHTALDNTVGGHNDILARKLGLCDVGPLRPSPQHSRFKVVLFTPESDHEAVLASAFAAGAGRIGDYEQCSFATPGEGTFFGNEGTNPTVGQAGRRETAREFRVEIVCPGDRLSGVLAAVRAAHSYEEPAIDVFPLHVPETGPGTGRIGRLAKAESLETFARRVAGVLEAPGLQYVGDPGRPVLRVAIACGGADDFVGDAARAGAEAFLTGEARFHRALEAEALGMGLVVAGHHATERPGVEELADRIAEAFPKLTVWPSRREHDPLRMP
ncbi:Nif3-like dinuclear metal center hexameric protein [soil metagenome]